MNKIKLYLIIGAVLFLAGSVVTVNIQAKIIKKRNETIDRLQYNVNELLTDNDNLKVLTFTEKELKGKYLRERDSLAGVLKIRPKTIEKIVTNVIRQTDTVYYYLPVVQKTDTSWTFIDNGNCYVYKGTVYYSDDSCFVEKNDFFYQNKIDNVYYWKRNFPIFGKKKFYQKSLPECGEVETTEINIKKSRSG